MLRNSRKNPEKLNLPETSLSYFAARTAKNQLNIRFVVILGSFQMYLMKYGYMDNHHATHGDGRSAQLLSPDGLRNYIMDFQGFAGLNQTGVLDDETVKMMEMPRSQTCLNLAGF